MLLLFTQSSMTSYMRTLGPKTLDWPPQNCQDFSHLHNVLSKVFSTIARKNYLIHSAGFSSYGLFCLAKFSTLNNIAASLQTLADWECREPASAVTLAVEADGGYVWSVGGEPQLTAVPKHPAHIHWCPRNQSARRTVVFCGTASSVRVEPPVLQWLRQVAQLISQLSPSGRTVCNLKGFW